MPAQIGRPLIASVLLITTFVCGAAGAARAQFSITRFTIDGGGSTRAVGGPYTLGGTIGQPDASRLAGGLFTLGGGFWLGGGGVSGVAVGPPGAGPRPETPLTFQVYPPSRNPVSSRTSIAFDLPLPGPVVAAVYDLTGRPVRVLIDEQLPPGRHECTWDRRDGAGRPVVSAVYFLRLKAGANSSREKLTVLP